LTLYEIVVDIIVLVEYAAIIFMVQVKGKAFPLQALGVPGG
jgi:hypothetical protein